MQTITTSWFVQGMIKATSDAWLKGWDERNGGNLTLRLDDADIEPFAADFHQKPRYIALSQPMPLLANTPFIVTGSGKFFRNVQLDPQANLGVVKVDSDGAGYHILWGLTDEAVPTSELPAHFPLPLRAHQGHQRQRPRDHALPCHQPDRPDLRAGKQR